MSVRVFITVAVMAMQAGLLPGQTPVVPPSEPAGRKAATDGKVWGALVYASAQKTEPAAKVTLPKGLEDLHERLGKVFGDFSHFEIIGQHTQDIFREYESWVVPSRDLFLKVDSKGPAEGGGMNLHLQFWQDQQVLVKSDAVLRSQSPLFIGGPKWREGRLIFVLQLTNGGGK